MSEPTLPQSEPLTLREHNGYPIYPMPAFVALEKAKGRSSPTRHNVVQEIGAMLGA